MYLFDLASRHMTWLAGRQALTAANIANADTPGYGAREISPFSEVLDLAGLKMAKTAPLHMTADPGIGSEWGARAGTGWDSAHSGNNVSIEKELMTASSTSRMMNIDTSLTRSFHRMLLASVKV